MDRIVSQILAEMDDLTTDAGSVGDVKDVFVIGATNRPDLLEPALLRPGRFDRRIYINVCEDEVSKISVLRAQTRAFDLAPDVDLGVVSAQLPPRMAGADIGAVCHAAYSFALEKVLARLGALALNRSADVINYNDERTCSEISMFLESVPETELKVLVCQVDFLQALQRAKSSITEAELDEYRVLGTVFDSNIGAGAQPSTADRQFASESQKQTYL